MSRWIEIEVVHKALWGIVILLVTVGVAEKLFALYREFVHVQPDLLIISILVTALMLQGGGGASLVRASRRWRHIGFAALYFVGVSELLLYIGSALMLSQPDICSTLVGDEAVAPLVAQVIFLVLLVGMHVIEVHGDLVGRWGDVWKSTL